MFYYGLLVSSGINFIQNSVSRANPEISLSIPPDNQMTPKLQTNQLQRTSIF